MHLPWSFEIVEPYKFVLYIMCGTRVLAHPALGHTCQPPTHTGPTLLSNAKRPAHQLHQHDLPLHSGTHYVLSAATSGSMLAYYAAPLRNRKQYQLSMQQRAAQLLAKSPHHTATLTM